jgi:hypothetical protein
MRVRAGVLLHWIVDPETCMASVYTNPSKSTVLDDTQAPDGGRALPEFMLPLKERSVRDRFPGNRPQAGRALPSSQRLSDA